MTDMDWPITEEARERPADTRALATAAAGTMFGRSTDASDAMHISAPHRVVRIRTNQRRRTALLLGAGAIALLAFGAVTRLTQKGGPSVTEQLPRASAPSDAVTNLPPPNLLKPVSPEEAIKENSDRPFVNRPDTPATRFVLRTDADDRERALTCLTQAVYYEAAGEGVDGGRA